MQECMAQNKPSQDAPPLLRSWFTAPSWSSTSQRPGKKTGIETQGLPGRSWQTTGDHWWEGDRHSKQRQLLEWGTPLSERRAVNNHLEVFQNSLGPDQYIRYRSYRSQGSQVGTRPRAAQSGWSEDWGHSGVGKLPHPQALCVQIQPAAEWKCLGEKLHLY